MTTDTLTHVGTDPVSAPAQVTLTDAINHGVGLAVAGFSVPEAASEVASMDLDDSARDTFVLDGIMTRIRGELGAINGAAKATPVTVTTRSGGGAPRSGKSAPVAKPNPIKAWYIAALGATNYADASGSRKSLLEFGLKDVSALLIASTAKREGYARLEAALQIAQDALKATGVKTVEQLPATDIERIARAIA